MRLAQKTRASPAKLGVPAVQNLVNNPKVLASRDLDHPCKLDRQSFLSGLRQTGRNFKTRQKCYGRRHKLPQPYGRIMGTTKLWPSITPVSLGKSAAAWAWVRAFKFQNLRQVGVQLKETSITKHFLFKFKVKQQHCYMILILSGSTISKHDMSFVETGDRMVFSIVFVKLVK